MSLKIHQDHSRFKQIVRGRIKKELRKYITKGELIGRKGKNLVSIPLPQIDIPRFRYGQKQTGGVGQGDGDVGTPIAGDPNQPGQGSGAGEQPGEHILEVDVELSELAKILGEELRVALHRVHKRAQIMTQHGKAAICGRALDDGLKGACLLRVDHRVERGRDVYEARVIRRKASLE